MEKFAIWYDKTQIPSVSAPGRQDYAFAFTAPTGQVLSVWMESWQDGKCEIGRLDETITAKTNEPINGVLHFSLADGATMSAESAGKKRYDWTIELTKNRETPVKGTETVKWDCGEWRKDILNWPGAMFVGGLDNDVYNNSCHPKSGETVTLLWVDTYDPGVGSVEMNRHSSLCQVPLLQGKPKGAIALRARFSPAAPGEMKSGYCDAGLQVRAAAALVTPAQFAIATEIGSDLRLCKTPAEATTKLIATAGTPEGRKRAEQMLRELGGTVATNAAPEALIKTLDEAVWKLATNSPAAPASPAAPGQK